MAIKLKNVRPGILIVPDAGLRLAPGEVAEVQALTTQLKAALKRGWLVNVEPANNAMPLFDEPALGESGQSDSGREEEVEITRLPAPEAISRVSKGNDAGKLKALLATEKRRTVLDALKKRLEEIDGDPE